MGEKQVSHTVRALTPTGEQAYALLVATYGLPLKASTFVRTLVDGHGNADMLACQLMEWILDWYRPTEDGKKRYVGDMPYLDSRGLAIDLNVSERKLKRARLLVSHTGLVVFHSHRHACLIEIQWSKVFDVLRSEAVFRGADNGPSKFRGTDNGTSKPLRGTDNGTSKALDVPITVHTLPLPSSFSSSSFEAREEEDVEKSGEEVSHTLAETVERCLEFGREHGRSCIGRWASDALCAFSDAVAQGRDPDVLEAAWRHYVSRLGGEATDLGHWIRGQGLNGQPRDEGEDAFEVCYTRAEGEARRAREKALVEAGGVPTPSFRHSSEGWLVSATGLPMQFYDAVPADASKDEAEAAWDGWYRAQRGGV